MLQMAHAMEMRRAFSNSSGCLFAPVARLAHFERKTDPRLMLASRELQHIINRCADMYCTPTTLPQRTQPPDDAS
jgi:hypothetical protein